MTRTLVVLIHPDLEGAVINKHWIDTLKKYPDQYVLHDLYRIYPDEKIDVSREQQLLETYDRIVFQFPFYWFNCPPLFKKWLDEVLTYGWAYGSGSPYKLAGKKIMLGITAGIDKEDYSSSGRYKYTLEQLTAPFELTFAYVKADYKSFFAFYGAEHNASPERIAQSAKDYMSFLQAF